MLTVLASIAALGILIRLVGLLFNLLGHPSIQRWLFSRN